MRLCLGALGRTIQLLVVCGVLEWSLSAAEVALKPTYEVAIPWAERGNLPRMLALTPSHASQPSLAFSATNPLINACQSTLTSYALSVPVHADHRGDRGRLSGAACAQGSAPDGTWVCACSAGLFPGI